MDKDEVKKDLEVDEIEPSNLNKLILGYKTDIMEHFFGTQSKVRFACIIIGACFFKGLIDKFVYKWTFVHGFIYPLALITIVSVIYVILKAISFKNSKLSECLNVLILLGVAATMLIFKESFRIIQINVVSTLIATLWVFLISMALDKLLHLQ